MVQLPFDQPGQFWRGNLHTHSTHSDGHLSPEAVCAIYREAGYDFLALTDHFLERYGWPLADTRPFRTADFTTLIGAELHAGQTERGSLWHLLAVGLPLDFAPPAADEDGPGIAQRALKAGAYVAAAHPAWYNLTEQDVLSLGDVHAIETYNGTSDDHNDRADSWYMLDMLLNRGRRYSACATDDAHFSPRRGDFMLGWTWVKSDSLTPESLLEALKRGHYYSSTGPQLHEVRVIPGEKVIVRCSPVERVFLVGSGAPSSYAYGPGLTEAELSLEKFPSDWGRIIVRDRQGQRAWSNPFWFDDFR